MVKGFFPFIFILLFFGCTEGQSIRVSKLDRKIVSALEKNSPNKSYHLESPAGSQVRLGNRDFISSHLFEIFGPSVSSEIEKNITSQVSNFGGPCDPHDSIQCPLNAQLGSEASLLPKSFSGREVLRIRTCDLIAQKDEAIQFAMTKAQAWPGTILAVKAPSIAELGRLFQLFYPGKIPDEIVVDSLYHLSLEALNFNKNKSPFESWRFVLLTLCIAPDWQIL